MSLVDIRGPILVIIRGIPGSGKSYVANELVRFADAWRFEVLDPDAVDQADGDFSSLSRTLSEEGVDARFHLYRYLRARAFAAIREKKIIVWNQPFVDFAGLRTTIEKLAAYAKEQGVKLPVLVVELELDPETARHRVNVRKSQNGHGPDDEKFTDFVASYTSFAGQGYETMSVQGSGDVKESARSIAEAIGRVA